MSPKNKTLTVRVSPEKHAEYAEYAKNQSMNLSKYVIKLIEDDINACKSI